MDKDELLKIATAIRDEVNKSSITPERLGNVLVELVSALKDNEFPSEGGDIVVDSELSASSENPVQNKVVKAALDGKQDKLVSGENIKTINGQSVLGEGEITILGSGQGVEVLGTKLTGLSPSIPDSGLDDSSTVLGAFNSILGSLYGGKLCRMGLSPAGLVFVFEAYDFRRETTIVHLNLTEKKIYWTSDAENDSYLKTKSFLELQNRAIYYGQAIELDYAAAVLTGFDEEGASGSIKSTTTVIEAIEILARCVENGKFRVITGQDSIIFLGIGGTTVSPSLLGIRFDISTKKIRMGVGSGSLFNESDGVIANESASWPEVTSASGGGSVTVDSELSASSENPVQNKVVRAALDSKQDKLVSGENIKTINGQSVLGEGEITISGLGKNDVLSGLNTENISYDVDKTMTVEQAIGIILGRLNGGNSIRLARSASGFILGFGVDDSVFDLYPILILFDMLQGKIYWKSDHSYDSTMFSQVSEIEESLKQSGTELSFAPDVMQTIIGAFGMGNITGITVESTLKEILSMLVQVVDNGNIRFVKTTSNDMVILLKGNLKEVPALTYGIRINAASGKIYFGNGDITLFNDTYTNIAAASEAWDEMTDSGVTISETLPEPLSIGPGEVLSLTLSIDTAKHVQIEETGAGVYESYIFVPSQVKISFDAPDGYDKFLVTLGQATSNTTEYKIKWIIGENSKRVFITRTLY